MIITYLHGHIHYFFSPLQPDQREMKIRSVFQFTTTPENDRILYLQVMLSNICTNPRTCTNFMQHLMFPLQMRSRNQYLSSNWSQPVLLNISEGFVVTEDNPSEDMLQPHSQATPKLYVCFVCNISSIVPKSFPDFISQLWRKLSSFLHSCKIKSVSGPGTMLDMLHTDHTQSLSQCSIYS